MRRGVFNTWWAPGALRPGRVFMHRVVVDEEGNDDDDDVDEDEDDDEDIDDDDDDDDGDSGDDGDEDAYETRISKN